MQVEPSTFQAEQYVGFAEQIHWGWCDTLKDSSMSLEILSL